MAQRTFYSGSVVRYRADGSVLKGGKPGAWTLDAYLRCQSLKLKPQKLVIEGNRLYFLYDKDRKDLEPYLGPGVKIEIVTASSPPSISALQDEIAKVFVPSNHTLESFVPDYWVHYLLHPGEDITPSLHKKGATPPPGVTPPRVVRKPEPEYTPEARHAGIQGEVIVWMVVDSTGRVTKVEIWRPLGMGLDDNAARTVQTWKFKPSTRNGKPIAVRVMAEISFKFP